MAVGSYEKYVTIHENERIANQARCIYDALLTSHMFARSENRTIIRGCSIRCIWRSYDADQQNMKKNHSW